MQQVRHHTCATAIIGRIMLECCLGHLRDQFTFGTSGLMWSLPVLPNWYICSAIDTNKLQKTGDLPF